MGPAHRFCLNAPTIFDFVWHFSFGLQRKQNYLHRVRARLMFLELDNSEPHTDSTKLFHNRFL